VKRQKSLTGENHTAKNIPHCTKRNSPPVKVNYTDRHIIITHGKWWGKVTSLWSLNDLHDVGHDVVTCQVNWSRFVTLFK